MEPMLVEITYEREDKEPSDGIGKDNPTDEMGTESFAVWYGWVGPTSLTEASHTPNHADLDANKEGHAEDTSPDEGVDTDASTETSVVPYAHEESILGLGPSGGSNGVQKKTRKCHYE